MNLSQYKSLLASGVVAKAKVKRTSPEEDLHRACVEWVEFSQAKHPILRWLVHVPNGGKRAKGEAGKLKAMGTKRGVPDLILPRPSQQWRGLAVELKSAVGTVSKDQKDWLDALSDDGWLVAVCRTLEEFVGIAKLYLEGDRGGCAMVELWRPARRQPEILIRSNA